MLYEFDTIPTPQRVTAEGISSPLPGVVTPLAWTTGGAALEYSLRMALCSSLQLLPWPPPDCTWALCGLTDAKAYLNRDALVQAVDRAGDHPRLTALRAARVRRSTERNGAADTALASSMREGRLAQSGSPRSTDDLLLCASRLLELLFRCLAHFASASIAKMAGERRLRDAAAVAATIALPRPLPLWGVDPAGPLDRSATELGPELRPLADAIAVASSELVATVDGLGSSWADHGLLGRADDVAFLRYEELPEIGGDRLSHADIAERTQRRREQYESCRALQPV